MPYVPNNTVCTVTQQGVVNVRQYESPNGEIHKVETVVFVSSKLQRLVAKLVQELYANVDPPLRKLSAAALLVLKSVKTVTN